MSDKSGTTLDDHRSPSIEFCLDGESKVPGKTDHY